MADEPSPEPTDSDSSADDAVDPGDAGGGDDVTRAEQLMEQALGDAQSSISEIERLTGEPTATALESESIWLRDRIIRTFLP